MKNYPTPHIDATPGDFAKTVIMPGDPLRAQKIAEDFLEDCILVSRVRAVPVYTGTYKGKRISVTASGMGCPSMGIYSHELFNIFGVENIIRTGSAGALRSDVNVRDIVLAMGACTDSAYISTFGLPGTFCPIADYSLLREAADEAEKTGIAYHVGNVFTSDCFYSDNPEFAGKWAKAGALAVEMETAALYANAAMSGKRALSILTVSDSLVTGEATTSSERQNSFTQMMSLALSVALRQERV